MEVPVSSHRAFVFNANGQPGHRIRTTFRQFVSELEHTPPTLLAGYIMRGDFSRWIGDVFGDRALAGELQALEERYRAGSRAATVPELASAVRSRYDLAEDELEDEEGLRFSAPPWRIPCPQDQRRHRRLRGHRRQRCAATGQRTELRKNTHWLRVFPELSIGRHAPFETAGPGTVIAPSTTMTTPWRSTQFLRFAESTTRRSCPRQSAATFCRPSPTWWCWPFPGAVYRSLSKSRGPFGLRWTCSWSASLACLDIRNWPWERSPVAASA